RGGEEVVHREPGHPKERAGSRQRPQVAKVIGVAAVTDLDLAEVHALVLEDALLLEARSIRWIRVGHDRRAGPAMRPRSGPQHLLDVRRDAGDVGGALDE